MSADNNSYFRFAFGAGPFDMWAQVNFDGTASGSLGIHGIGAVHGQAALSDLLDSLNPFGRSERTYLRAQWAEDSPAADAIFITPDGTRIAASELDDLGSLVPELSSNRQHFYVLNRPPQALRSWDVEFFNVSGPVNLSVFADDGNPHFEFTDVQLVDHELQVDFKASDLESTDVDVTFWLDVDGEGFDGVAISEVVTGSDGKFQWRPAGVASGSYHLYVEVDDGINEPVQVYHDHPITLETQSTSVVSAGNVGGIKTHVFTAQVAGDPLRTTRMFTVSNQGTAPLSIEDVETHGIALNGYSVEVVMADGERYAPGPFAIPAGSQVSVEVSFDPTSAGRKGGVVRLIPSDSARPPIELLALGFGIPDDDAPQSTVSAMQASTFAYELPVRWSATDGVEGSGIASYDIYVASDEGPFILWLNDVTATSATLEVESGSNYRFYSLATDRAGNVEAAKSREDTFTEVTSPFWHNRDARHDVNDDDHVTPSDVLLIIDELNSPRYHTSGQPLPLPALGEEPPFYLDTNGDGYVTPSDALIVIDLLNRSSLGSGEGEVSLNSDRFASSNFDGLGRCSVFEATVDREVDAACADPKALKVVEEPARPSPLAGWTMNRRLSIREWDVALWSSLDDLEVDDLEFECPLDRRAPTRTYGG